MNVRCILVFLAALSLLAATAWAEPPQEWEVLNPAGVMQKATVKPAARVASLDGKTIVLRWNGKNNGDVALDKLAELLAKKAPTAKIVKSYALDPSINKIAGSPGESERINKVIMGHKPDLVIASQAD
jgi:ABC-type Fe3+-hydroxamate transport system substrate-binding protein